ncbi:MAG: hypothetical protein JWP06_637 [Candidatus Saccharibacteria bacterium]|nr:hypothetical protein [Candidatus Saccharibacteria bacterium]
MSKSDMPVPPALDKILNELQSKATEAGYHPRIVLNMRYHPEMLDIMARMISAELEHIKKERKDENLQKQQ